LRAEKTRRGLKWILLAEGYLHLVNPWILAAATALLIISAIAYHSLVSWIILSSGLLLLALKPYRTWVTMQLCLVMGALKNLHTREIIWAKQAK